MGPGHYALTASEFQCEVSDNKTIHAWAFNQSIPGPAIDASETRLGDYRFLTLWDEVSNWMTISGKKLKYAMAISEARSDYGERGKPPYDDIYSMSPVNYVKIDHIPTVYDMSSLIGALKRG